MRGGRGIGKEGKRNERRKEMEKRGEETREGKEREERRGESNTPCYSTSRCSTCTSENGQ